MFNNTGGGCVSRRLGLRIYPEFFYVQDERYIARSTRMCGAIVSDLHNTSTKHTHINNTSKKVRTYGRRASHSLAYRHKKVREGSVKKLGWVMNRNDAAQKKVAPTLVYGEGGLETPIN